MKRVLAFAALAAFSAAGFAQQKLKFAHVYETSEPYHTYAVWAGGEIAKRTGNRYSMDVFPASQLGNETQINQSLTLASVDMIYTGQLFAGRSHGPISIGGAPFMFRDFDHWQKFAKSPLFRELADGYQKASGGNAVLTILMPSLTASRQQSGPSPVVQCVCSSIGIPLALANIIGTSVCTRSGVSKPPGSLRQSRLTLSDAAWRVRSANYSSVCFGETE